MVLRTSAPNPVSRGHGEPVVNQRSHWPTVVSGAGVVLLVLAGVRLLTDTTTTVLGTSASCGNAFAYLSGADTHASALAVALCRPSLHNAATETVVLGFFGLVFLLIGATQATTQRSNPVHTNPSSQHQVPPAPPGWYPSPQHPGYERWWYGGSWSEYERPMVAGPPQ